MALLPLFAMVFVLMDTAWSVFSEAALQRAVRMGVRYGITITGAQTTPGTCLTAMVKTAVQQNAIGLLNGPSGLSKIKVNYFLSPQPDANSPPVDVSGQNSGNAGGNIMQVSVQNFSILPLVGRVFNWKTAPDKNPVVVSVYAADLIEPSLDPPCIGTAP